MNRMDCHDARNAPADVPDHARLLTARLHRCCSVLWAVIVLLLALSLLVLPAAGQATITVNTTADSLTAGATGNTIEPNLRYDGSSTQGQTSIVAPTSVTFGGSIFFLPPERMIDGSGLSGAGSLLSQTHSGGGSDENNFKTTTSEATSNPIIFTLGGTFDLTDVHIWNYTHSGFDFFFERDTQNIDIALSTDGINFTPAGSITLSSSLGFPPPFLEVAQSFSLTGTASHVRFEIQNNYGGG